MCGRGWLWHAAVGRSEMGRSCGRGEVQGAARKGLKGVIENERGGGGGGGVLFNGALGQLKGPLGSRRAAGGENSLLG